jgi:hypothetical protein
LPKSLASLREESKNIQTIAGSFNLLKNNVMEFVGMQASSSGAVSAITTAVSSLANNLNLVAGAVLTLTAAKLGTWMDNTATRTMANVAANRALVASNLAAAEAHARATAQASLLANARLEEVRAATLAASGATQVALATNGLIPAQAKATAAAEAHALAMTQLAIAQRAASTAASTASKIIGALGGPIGALITVLGLAATAWSWYKAKQDEANSKAKEQTEQSTLEIISNLEKQNAKLRERILLAKMAGMTGVAQEGGAAVEHLAKLHKEITDLKAKGMQMTIDEQLRVINLNDIYLPLLKNLREEKQLKTDLAQMSSENDLLAVRMRLTGVNQQYLDDLKTLHAAYENGALKIDAYRAAVTQLATETYKGSVAGRAATNDANKQEDAYKSLITSIKEKIAAAQQEANGWDKMSEAQKLQIALQERMANKDLKMSPERKKAYEDLIAQLRVQELVIDAQKRATDGAEAFDKMMKEITDQRRKGVDDAVREAERNEALARTYGMTKGEIEKMELARLEEQLAQRSSVAMTLDEIQHLEQLIAAKKRSVAAATELDGKEAIAKAKDDLDKFLDPGKAQSFGDALKSAFGEAGGALGKLTGSLQAYGIKQAEIEKARKNAETAYVKGSKEYLKVSLDIAAKEAQGRLGAYGDMTGAAKDFFKEGTTGYKMLEAAEQTFRAFELALAVKNMLAKSGLVEAFTGVVVAGKATETAATVASVGPDVAASMAKGQAAAAAGVAAQAQGEPYSAWVRMAAMAAAMAALGFAVSGGSKPDTTAKDRQAAAGTGSILGDATAKSDSIAKAVELAAKNSSIELNYTAGMLRALRSIESNIGSFASLLVRTTDLNGSLPATQRGGAYDFGNSTLGVLATGGIIGAVLNKLTGGFVGRVTGTILGSIFGGKTSALDTGLMANRATLGDILSGGFSASQYTDMKKDGGWFSSDKKWTDTTSLGAEANSQFGLVIKSMADGISEAGKLLGINSYEFASKLNSFVVDIGKISFKDLTGEQIQKQLEMVFAKMGDDMASFAVENIGQFQKVGEGALQTLVRIAANYANLDALLRASGMAFGAVGVSSVAARERLIGLAGGIDALANKMNSFADNFLTEDERLAPVRDYVRQQLAAIGLSWVKTRDQFKFAAMAIDKTTDAGARQFAAMMDLADAFAKVTPAAEGFATTLADRIAQARRDLTDAYDAEVEAITATQERMSSFAQTLRGIRDSALLGNLSPLTPMQKYAEARRQFEEVRAGAMAGDAVAQGKFHEAYTAFLEASKEVNASGAQYQADFAYAQQVAEEALVWAEKQVSIEQASLDALNKQVAGLIDVKNAVMSVHDALIALANLQNEAANPQLGNSASIESLYQALLNRSADSDGMRFWLDAMASGASIADVSGWISKSDEYTSKHPSVTDYSAMVSAAPVVEAIQSLQVSTEALVGQIAGLREDQQQQTADMIGNQAATSAENASKIADATAAAVKAVKQETESRVALA